MMISHEGGNAYIGHPDTLKMFVEGYGKILDIEGV